MKVKIEDIKIGKRHRVDMGDIAGLAASIEHLGLLHPVVISSKKELIAGKRRLLAFEKLGRREIEATIIDVAALVLGEQGENTIRKDLSVSERVAIGRAVEKLLGGRRGGDRRSRGKILPFDRGKTTEIAAQKAGFRNRTTYQQAKAVVEAGGKAVDDMNRSGRVFGSYQRVKAKQPMEGGTITPSTEELSLPSWVRDDIKKVDPHVTLGVVRFLIDRSLRILRKQYPDKIFGYLDDVQTILNKAKTAEHLAATEKQRLEPSTTTVTVRPFVVKREKASHVSVPLVVVKREKVVVQFEKPSSDPPAS
jgi:ParB-like chromosome segregation protein Spo0J